MSAAKKLQTKIPNSLIAKIHILKSQNKLDDDTYRDLLFQWTGENSSKDITYSQGITVCENLQAMIDAKKINTTMHLVNEKKQTKWVYKKGGLTEPQYGCIMGKAKSLNYSDSRLEGFIFHTIKKYSAPEDLTVKEASQVISGLQHLQDGK